MPELASGVFGRELLALYKTKSEPDKSGGGKIVEFYRRAFLDFQQEGGANDWLGTAARLDVA